MSKSETIRHSLKKTAFIVLQYITPQHALSRLVGFFARSQIKWLKNLLITNFIKKFDVDMSESLVEDGKQFIHFNDFFCRQLKPTARPIAPENNGIISPADGAISQVGKIEEGRIFQAKGRDFTTAELLGGDKHLAEKFTNGQFTTIYLSPKDYHRVHMPIDGELVSMHHIPGALFSVNPTTTESVPRLFARNERVVTIFKTEFGPVAIILVGAMIVASIDTVWGGQIAPAGRKVQVTNYNYQSPIRLKKGQEMGRFKLGSTVIMLFPENSMEWEAALSADDSVRMGQLIGKHNSSPIQE